MLKDDLDKWFAYEGSIADYREGLNLMQRSGVFNLLRRIGIPGVIGNGESVNIMAGQAHWSNGYQSCLDHIKYFEEYFSSKLIEEKIGLPDFGGEENALKRGLVSVEDLRKIKEKK